MENLNRIIYPLIPKEFRGILNRWRNRNCTEDFYIEIAEATCSIPECIDDFRWHSPPTPTAEYRSWKILKKDEQEEFIKTKYNFYVKNIKNFTDDVYKVVNFNNRNREQLKEWLKLNITQESRIKIEQVLDTHSGK